MTATDATHATGPSLDSEGQLVVQRTEELLAAHDPKRESVAEFGGARFDAGLAWVHFPEGCGGLGVSPRWQDEVDRRLGAAGAERTIFSRNPIAGMAAPTIVAHGSDDQKRRYLRPMYTCEEIWCQLFSEPGAGSDVASLATRAVRDGDEWVLNGQKVWTTMAHKARWGLLVARTDPDAPKHRGLTYFVLDLHAPGVEVRPLRQMTGEAEFNEVYLTDVRIPDAERLGDVGEGWAVSMTTLMNERVAIGGNVTPRGSGAIGDVLRLWHERKAAAAAGTGASGGNASGAGASGGNASGTSANGGDTDTDTVLRDRVARLWIEAEVLRLTNLRAGQNRRLGTPGPEGSVGKLAFAELNKRIYELCLDLLGPAGMLYGSYEMVRPDEVSFGVGGDVRKTFLRVRANSIEGGTSEVMRNILGERVLGLPGEPRLDKDLPWSQVPRS